MTTVILPSVLDIFNHRSRALRTPFRSTFDAEPSLELAARALASYLRTVVDGDSPFDRYAVGQRSALSESARRGLKLFQGKAGCGQCHAGPNLTDEEFHNSGVAWRTSLPLQQPHG